MEAPTQTLPRMEPGHVSEQVLPRVEGVGVHDDVPTSEYPKYIEHPVRGLTLANDADHEAMLQAEIAALPPLPPPSQQELAKAELEKIVGRPLTDLECMVGAAQLLEFVTEKRMLVTVHPEFGGTVKLWPDQPEDVTTQVSYYADGSSATGTAPLPDVSPEGALVVEAKAETPAVE